MVFQNAASRWPFLFFEHKPRKERAKLKRTQRNGPRHITDDPPHRATPYSMFNQSFGLQTTSRFSAPATLALRLDPVRWPRAHDPFVTANGFCEFHRAAPFHSDPRRMQRSPVASTVPRVFRSRDRRLVEPAKRPIYNRQPDHLRHSINTARSSRNQAKFTLSERILPSKSPNTKREIHDFHLNISTQPTVYK